MFNLDTQNLHNASDELRRALDRLNELNGNPTSKHEIRERERNASERDLTLFMARRGLI